MNKYNKMKFDDIEAKLAEQFTLHGSANLTVATWDDGDYFIELCEEDGGISDTQVDLFKNRPVGRKFNSQDDFFKYLRILENISCFQSNNGNRKLHFDVHVRIGSLYVVYNSLFKQVYMEEFGFFKKLFSPMVRPKWQDQVDID